MMSVPSTQHEATRLLVDWKRGNPDSAKLLMPLVYDELRLLARGYLQRERADHTLQATALVHEAYVRLVDQSEINWQSRAHFFSVAAKVMRRILVDHARRHRAEKRGGDQAKIEFHEELLEPSIRRLDLIALDDAMNDLAKLNAKHCQIVEMRFFGGLTNEEIAEVMESSPRTIQREWRTARAWLRDAVFPEKEHAGDA